MIPCSSMHLFCTNCDGLLVILVVFLSRPNSRMKADNVRRHKADVDAHKPVKIYLRYRKQHMENGIR